MKLKDKLLKLFLVEAVLISGITVLVAVVTMIPGSKKYENFSRSETVFYKLAEFDEFKSTFRAKYNNLSRLEVLFKNPNLESRDELQIELSDVEGKIISTKKFTGFNFGDTSRGRLDFGSIIKSKNKYYTVKIKTTKIIDGKLAFGVKDNRLDVAEYYASGSPLESSFSGLVSFWKKIVSIQAGVVLLPMILVGIWVLL